MKIFVGCSSKDNIPKKYIDDCTNYLEKLLKENDLVFGAYHYGLMASCYDIAKKNKREVIAVCPKVYEHDLREMNCDKEVLTDNISDRTRAAVLNSDALIYLPGGIGTVYELFATLELKRCHEFNKPIVLYNSCGYFDEVLALLDKMINENFILEEAKNLYHVSNGYEDTINYLNNYSK